MFTSVGVTIRVTEGSHSFIFELGLGQVFLPLVLPRGKGCKWRAAVHQLTDLFSVTLVTALFEKYFNYEK